MRVLRAILVGAILVTAIPAAAQTGPSMEVVVGIGGLTSPNRPSEVTVEISSPVLIAGRLRVRGGSISVSRPVEVPAGSEQTYRLTVPPLTDSTRLTVELLDGAGEAIAVEQVTTRGAGRDEMGVGVIGAPGLVDLLGRVRTVITSRPVVAIEIPAGVAATSLSVLDYVVVGSGASENAAAAFEWAEGGGRVVVDAAVAGDVAVDGLMPSDVEGVGRGRLGAGTAVIVEDLAGRSAEEWASILRPTGLDFTHSPEFGMEPQSALLQAASEAGSRQVPSIPWLLFAILGFAALVGPVNFIVLSRLRKRDWAWVTIPSLAILAVVGFWVAGRQRIAGTNLTHASLVVAEGGVETRSAVLVAAGIAGERRLSFAEGRIYPERSLFGSTSAELRMEGERQVSVELDQLGFTGIGFETPTSPDLPSVSLDDNWLVVDNNSSMSFWGWGSMIGGASSVAADSLAAGTGGRVAIPVAQRDFGMTFIDAVINRQQLWDDPARSNSLWPLSQLLWTEGDDNGIYFVGLTDDYRPQVDLADGAASVPGPTLVMIKVGESTDQEAGRAMASVVGTGFVNWVDWSMQRVISTDEMTVSFQLPDPGLEVRLTNASRFGNQPSSYAGWDWASSSFQELAIGEPLPASMTSADGAVYVRLSGENEFGDNPMSPNDLVLEWGTGT